jgi:predicted O-methyltransferase YrrM
VTTDQLIQANLPFKYRTRNLPWYPRKGTRNDLAVLFHKFGFNIGVEVGTYKGGYAKVLCDSNPNLHLTCVDPWRAYGKWSQEHEDAMYAIAVETLKGCNVTFLRKPSLEALSDFEDESLDFVFIDGDHMFDAVIQDIIHWTHKVRKEGIVLVNDYWVSGIGADVVKAVDAYTHCHGIHPWYMTRENFAPTAFWVKK